MVVCTEINFLGTGQRVAIDLKAARSTKGFIVSCSSLIFIVKKENEVPLIDVVINCKNRGILSNVRILY